MPKLKNVEKKIWDTEEFNVLFQKSGKDVHGAKKGIPQYPFTNMAKNSMTVHDWKKRRFAKKYPGYEAVVFDADGNKVPGNTTLGKLRDTYL